MSLKRGTIFPGGIPELSKSSNDAHECSGQRFGSGCHITDAVTQARPKLLVVGTDGLVDRLCCNRLCSCVLGWTLAALGRQVMVDATDLAIRLATSTQNNASETPVVVVVVVV